MGSLDLGYGVLRFDLLDLDRGVQMKKWICTKTGLAFDLQHPTAAMVCTLDIGHALANLCRFTGHCTPHYSVAEHCVRVSQIVAPEHRLAALLHDAAEAYMGDWSSPLKALIREEAPQLIEDLESRIDRAICTHFGISWPALHHPAIKQADRIMYATEKRDLMPRDPITDEVFGAFPDPLPERIFPWSVYDARAQWLNAMWDATGGRID